MPLGGAPNNPVLGGTSAFPKRLVDLLSPKSDFYTGTEASTLVSAGGLAVNAAENNEAGGACTYAGGACTFWPNNESDGLIGANKTSEGAAGLGASVRFTFLPPNKTVSPIGLNISVGFTSNLNAVLGSAGFVLRLPKSWKVPCPGSVTT